MQTGDPLPAPTAIRSTMPPGSPATSIVACQRRSKSRASSAGPRVATAQGRPGRPGYERLAGPQRAHRGRSRDPQAQPRPVTGAGRLRGADRGAPAADAVACRGNETVHLADRSWLDLPSRSATGVVGPSRCASSAATAARHLVVTVEPGAEGTWEVHAREDGDAAAIRGGRVDLNAVRGAVARLFQEHGRREGASRRVSRSARSARSCSAPRSPATLAPRSTICSMAPTSASS